MIGQRSCLLLVRDQPLSKRVAVVVSPWNLTRGGGTGSPEQDPVEQRIERNPDLDCQIQATSAAAHDLIEGSSLIHASGIAVQNESAPRVVALEPLDEQG